MNALVTEADYMGVHEVQWQTPEWNHEAIRFYNGVGAPGNSKVRFVLPIASPTDISTKRRTHRDVLDEFSNAWAAGDASVLRDCLHSDAINSPSVAIVGAPFRGIEAVLTAIRTMQELDQGARIDLGPMYETSSRITRAWTYHFQNRPSSHGVDVFSFRDGLKSAKDAFRKHQ